MEFIAATNNQHKLREMERILVTLGHTVRSQKEMGIDIDPKETGSTFAQNACIKAKAVCELANLPTIADDSGLCVDALQGAPGVYSARYCGHHGDDGANNEKLVKEMQSVQQQDRTARFVSAICVYLPDGRNFIFEGACEGSIAFVGAGENGFGYDPYFIPNELGVSASETVDNTQSFTYAQITADQKDAISHRGKALQLMQAQLPNCLASTEV